MLIDMYSLVENVAGSLLIIWGLANMLNKSIIQSFFDTFTNREKNETLVYLTASMFLTLGLITIWVHNDWYWSPAIIVTVLGWVLTVKTSLWLFFPKQLFKLTKQFSTLAVNLWFRLAYGLVSIILGALILGNHYFENLLSLIQSGL